MKYKSWIVLTIILITAFSLIFYFAYLMGGQTNSDLRISVASDFLEAAFSANDPTATTYLSPEARLAVDKYCDQHVISCFTSVVHNDWGKFENTLYEIIYASSKIETSIRFAVNWENQSSLVVVQLIQKDNKWLVSGWRGFIPLNSSEKQRVELLDGNYTINAFPPIPNT